LATALDERPETIVRTLARRPVSYLSGTDNVGADLLGPMDSLRAACDGIDAIVHLAGPNEVQAVADPDGTLGATVAGTRRLAMAAAEADVRRFVYVSTVHVYGAALADGAVVTEETLPAPRHPYALARLASEHVAAATPGLDVVSLRLTNSVGAPAHPSVDRWTLVANDLCRQAALSGSLELKSSGVQWRDFIALSDVCRTIAQCLDPSSIPAGTYNLGTGVPMTIRQLAGLVQDAFESRQGRRPELRAPEPSGPGPQPYIVSVARLNAFGCRPLVPVADAIGETAAFCLDHAGEL
jgi:UDP-glucose 4-epimerase